VISKSFVYPHGYFNGPKIIDIISLSAKIKLIFGVFESALWLQYCFFKSGIDGISPVAFS